MASPINTPTLRVLNEQLPLTEKCRHYERLGELPHHIRKYWHQRHEIFSVYDYDIRLTDDAWFSVTPEPVAYKIAEDLASILPTPTPPPPTSPQSNPKINMTGKRVVIDLFAGAGVNTFAFALSGHCDVVVAIERDPEVLACAQHNAAVYEVPEGKVVWVLGDCFDFMRRWKVFHGMAGEDGEDDSSCDAFRDAKTDIAVASSNPHMNASHPYSSSSPSPQPSTALQTLVRTIYPRHTTIFASPPWGGVSYVNQGQIFDLNAMQPYGLDALHKACTPLPYALYLPRTGNLRQLGELVPDGIGGVEAVQYCVWGASKALVFYMPSMMEDRRDGLE